MYLRIPVNSRGLTPDFPLIEKDGWLLSRSRGSHRQYKNPNKRGLVTIAGKPSHELAPGTLNSILKQAGVK